MMNDYLTISMRGLQSACWTSTQFDYKVHFLVFSLFPEAQQMIMMPRTTYFLKSVVIWSEMLKVFD